MINTACIHTYLMQAGWGSAQVDCPIEGHVFEPLYIVVCGLLHTYLMQAGVGLCSSRLSH